MSQNESLLTPEEFAAWLEHPVTEHFRQYLRMARLRLMEAWASAQYTHEIPEAAAQLNAKALGKVHAIEEILDLDIDAINHSKD